MDALPAEIKVHLLEGCARTSLGTLHALSSTNRSFRSIFLRSNLKSHLIHLALCHEYGQYYPVAKLIYKIQHDEIVDCEDVDNEIIGAEFQAENATLQDLITHFIGVHKWIRAYASFCLNFSSFPEKPNPENKHSLHYARRAWDSLRANGRDAFIAGMYGRALAHIMDHDGRLECSCWSEDDHRHTVHRLNCEYFGVDVDPANMDCSCCTCCKHRPQIYDYRSPTQELHHWGIGPPPPVQASSWTNQCLEDFLTGVILEFIENNEADVDWSGCDSPEVYAVLVARLMKFYERWEDICEFIAGDASTKADYLLDAWNEVNRQRYSAGPGWGTTWGRLQVNGEI